MAKFKVFWFSRAGKRLFKIILGIVIGVFTIIWIITTRIIYLQIKNDTSWLYAYNYMNMLNNIANNNWYEINNWLGKKKFSILWIDFYEIEKWKSRFELLLQIPNLKENTIKIDENFNKQLSSINPLIYGRKNHVGYFAWELKCVKKYKKPIPCKGKLGIWNYNTHGESDLYKANRCT